MNCVICKNISESVVCDLCISKRRAVNKAKQKKRSKVLKPKRKVSISPKPCRPSVVPKEIVCESGFKRLPKEEKFVFRPLIGWKPKKNRKAKLNDKIKSIASELEVIDLGHSRKKVEYGDHIIYYWLRKKDFGVQNGRGWYYEIQDKHGEPIYRCTDDDTEYREYKPKINIKDAVSHSLMNIPGLHTGLGYSVSDMAISEPSARYD